MDVKYTLEDISRGSTGYSETDTDLAGTYVVNTKFRPSTDFIEVHNYVEGDLVFSTYDYRSYTILSDSEFTEEGASRIQLNPIEDLATIDVIRDQEELYYYYYRNHFLTPADQNPYFFIESISDDRRELRLLSKNLSGAQVETLAAELKADLESTSTTTDFLLLFESNRRALGIAIDTIDYRDTKAVLVKLYEPLSQNLGTRIELQIVQELSDPTIIKVTTSVTPVVPQALRLRGPNFSSQDFVGQVSNLGYVSTLDLLDTTTYNAELLKIVSKTADESIELSIDYSSFSNFINYSSATERLKNFRYKTRLIESYAASITALNSTPEATKSIEDFQNKIDNIVQNFDHYEQHLYYESGSTTWPKSNSTRPYALYHTTASQAIAWYAEALEDADIYDNSNYNQLLNAIPEYLREDEANAPLSTFVYMLGQHFDNLWIYTKALSSKYDTDNRLSRGVPKDLLEAVLINFGIKIHEGSQSIDDLFKYFIKSDQELASEVINEEKTVDTVRTSGEDYRRELYKRLYHNLPALLKSKGTDRGFKALMATFGIPTEVMPIKLYGGTDKAALPNFGPYLPLGSGSIDKVRSSTTRNIEGFTLIPDKAIQRPQIDYVQDSHAIEIGPSPVDSINAHIVANITSSYDVDNWLGDPRGFESGKFRKFKQDTFGDLDRYDLKDFVRLIKFYDNRFFRMVRDFAPARSVVDSGIVIKPNVLDISIGPPTTTEGLNLSQFLEGEIDTAFISGGDGRSFGAKSDYVTSYTESVHYPDGMVERPTSKNGYTIVARSDGETPRYTGELSGSVIKGAEKELNIANTFKRATFFDSFYNITPITAISDIPIVFVCCLPTFTSITEAGSNINLNFTLGSGEECITATSVTYQSSADGITWSGTTTVGTGSPISFTKPITSTYYRIRTECLGGSFSTYTAPILYTVATTTTTTTATPPYVSNITASLVSDVTSEGDVRVTYTRTPLNDIRTLIIADDNGSDDESATTYITNAQTGSNAITAQVNKYNAGTTTLEIGDGDGPPSVQLVVSVNGTDIFDQTVNTGNLTISHTFDHDENDEIWIQGIISTD
jgi:hypothetical protein